MNMLWLMTLQESGGALTSPTVLSATVAGIALVFAQMVAALSKRRHQGDIDSATVTVAKIDAEAKFRDDLMEELAIAKRDRDEAQRMNITFRDETRDARAEVARLERSLRDCTQALLRAEFQLRELRGLPPREPDDGEEPQSD